MIDGTVQFRDDVSTSLPNNGPPWHSKGLTASCDLTALRGKLGCTVLKNSRLKGR